MGGLWESVVGVCVLYVCGVCGVCVCLSVCLYMHVHVGY